MTLPTMPATTSRLRELDPRRSPIAAPDRPVPSPGDASFRRAWQCRAAGRFSLGGRLDLASGARPPIYNAAMDETDTLPGLPLPAFEPGWVWLAGAGPGDPGLLTLLALHGLRHADIIVYDALVGPGVLALAPPGAALEYAGKR